MTRAPTSDPISRLSWAERRAWRATDRRLHREHDGDQLAELVGLAVAGGGVTGISTPNSDGADLGATPVELIIDGRRVRAARVHRRTLAKLGEAMSSIAAVPLTAVGRYGTYWVLTFRLATEQLVVLAEQLTLLPEWGGPGGREPVPSARGPRTGLAV